MSVPEEVDKEIGGIWVGVGLDWIGLDWTGLDWTGLDWTGLSINLRDADWSNSLKSGSIHRF
jgi:hypothetical protein